MVVTGVDNVIYSDRPLINFVRSYVQRLERVIWPNVVIEIEPVDGEVRAVVGYSSVLSNIVSEERGEVSLYFVEDQKMMSEWDERGYHLNEKNEGGFCLISRARKNVNLEVEVVADSIVVTNCEDIDYALNVESYDSVCFFQSIWQYTLVTPGDVHQGFSRKIYDLFLSELRDA